MLVEGLDIRFLITTRTRPDWFTPRLEVYGEGLEIGVDELTMTDEEAALVLNAVGAVAGRARLMRTADGWPAVLGLAAMSGDVDFTSSRLLSHTLYEFLASELLASATEETQAALMLLAVANVTEVDVARTVSGHRHRRRNRGRDGTRPDLGHGTQVALTAPAPARTAGRPLRARSTRRARAALLVRTRRLFSERRWDEALCVAEVSKDAAFATEAIGAALDDLLAAGRTSSLQRWVSAARAAGAEGGLIDYAESEALLRGDELDRAIALATQAAGSLEGDLAARAHLVAGRSAHLADRPSRHEDTRRCGRRDCAENSRDSRGSTLVAFSCALRARKRLICGERLDDFKAAARPGLQQSLMIATGRLWRWRNWKGDSSEAIDDARRCFRWLERRRSHRAYGALERYSYALIMTGRYEESLTSSEDTRRVAESCGVEFPVPYAQLYSARHTSGCAVSRAADRVLSALEREMRERARASSFVRNLPIQRARLYASVGDPQRAFDVLSLGPASNGAASDLQRRVSRLASALLLPLQETLEGA